MKTATIVARVLVGITGVTLLILGVLFWTHHALQLIPVHMGIGLLFVLALWALATLAAFARVQRGLVILGFVWGIVVIALGATQTRILPGSAHWIVKVLHLLVGIAAMGLAARLTAAIRARRQGARELGGPERAGHSTAGRERLA